MVHRRILVCLVGIALCASSCSSADTSESPARSTRAEDRSSISIGKRDATLIAGPDLELSVPADAVDGRGTARADVDPSIEAISMAGFTPRAAPRVIELEGTIVAPVTLTFAPSPDDGPEGALPVIMRFDDGWYPIAVGEVGKPAVASREGFSPIWFGWLDPAAWFESFTSGLQKLAGVRTDPPRCSGAAPKWAATQSAGDDVVLTCSMTNKEGRAELQLKNNRGVVVEVGVPEGTAYAWVEGQPDPVRNLVRTWFGRDLVMLPPGSLMTMGWDRPTFDTVTTVSADVTIDSVVVDALMRSFGAFGADALLPGVLALTGCSGASDKLLDLPDGAAAVRAILAIVPKCIAGAAKDPAKAKQLAAQAIGLAEGTDAAHVLSDPKLRQRVEQQAGWLHLAGQAFAVIELTKAAAAYSDAAGGELGRGFDGDPDGFRTTTLDLTGTCSRKEMSVATRAVGLSKVTSFEGDCSDDWVEADFCDDEICADSSGLLHRIDGKWKYITGFPTTMCWDEAVEAGVPDRWMNPNDFQPCAPEFCPVSPQGYNGPVKVVVSEGDLGCAEASAVVDKYLNDPSVVYEGSSAFADFDGWTCFIDTIPMPSGALGTCENGSVVIEMHE